MNIGGHGLRDHVRLLAPLFGLIAAVWALRLVVYAAGVSPSSVWLRVVSVTVAGAASVLLAVLMIHRRQFGSYPTVVLAVFLLIVWEELLIAAAIAFTIFTGMANVYSSPAFSFGAVADWRYVAGHLTFGIGSGTIFGAAMGCLFLWVLRHAVPSPTAK